MTGPHHKTTDWSCSPFKTVLGKIGDRYESYCTTYRIHAMTTHHGGAGHTGEDKDLNSHVEGTGNIDDNESTHSLETISFGGTEVVYHLSDLLPNGQTDLHILTREIHSLQQCVEGREGQPAEGLDHIEHLEWELQTLSVTLSTQSTSTRTPS